MKIHMPENFDKNILAEVNDTIVKAKGASQMCQNDRDFLNGMIRQVRPKKIVEIGVSGGGASIIILNAIKDIEDAKLYSHDYQTCFNLDKTKPVGYFVSELFPELTNKWQLFSGGMVCNFLDEIGGDIDLCIIDTAHSNPGELLDYLQVLPYMKKNGIIILHDITLHMRNYNDTNVSSNIAYGTIAGEKILPEYTEDGILPNIGAVILDENVMYRAFDTFNCLSLPWSYLLSENDVELLKKHFTKHYGKKLTTWFLKTYNYNKRRLKPTTENKTVNNQNCSIMGDFCKYLTKIDAQKQIDKLAKTVKDKKIAVYGAGTFADAIFNNYDLSCLNIVTVVDKKYNKDSKEKYFSYPTTSPSALKDIDIDSVLIATLNAEPILDYLEDEILVNCKNSNLRILPIIKK